MRDLTPAQPFIISQRRAELADRSAEGKAERFARLKLEFSEDPNEVRLERMAEALLRYRQSGQDGRLLCFEGELAQLELWAKKLIKQRELAEGRR